MIYHFGPDFLKESSKKFQNKQRKPTSVQHISITNNNLEKHINSRNPLQSYFHDMITINNNNISIFMSRIKKTVSSKT